MPTFTGFVQNSMDGLILFEACLSGKLNHVPRRPHDRERSQLIKSGNIFIYEENASGIKRWTDGVAWSPSRILGNFLIYRELDKPFPPGEKKRAIKRKRSSLPGIDGFPRAESDSQENVEMPRPITPPEQNVNLNPDVKPAAPGSEQDKELERSLIGSLVDSYGFRADGLVKKTMSISINGISHHMVSYYKVDDVKHQALARPLQDPRLQHISVRPELYLKQNFRAPIEETEHYAIDGQAYAHPQMMYQMPNGQGVRPGQYFPGAQYPGMYAPIATSGAGPGAMYSAMPGTQWAQPSASSYGAPGYTTAPSYGSYYRPGSQSSAKPEDPHATSQAMGYGSSYPAPYSSVPRDGSHSSAGMMPQSSYQTPVQPGSSTFGAMSAPTGRPSYSGSASSPTSAGQTHQMYGAPQGGQSLPSQQYAVRSPSQSYGMQGAPQSATTQQSPHTSMKSPHPSAPASSTPVQPMSHDPYRSGSYPAPQPSHPSSDMNGLGISGGASYGHSYSSSGQNFRPVGDVAAPQAAGAHYAQ